MAKLFDMKLAKLFDMKVSGVGFHLTSHLIAIAALFVACFAITGYISFRSNTVPGKALKDEDVNFDDVTLTSIAHPGGYVEKVHYEQVTLAAGAANGGTNKSIHLLNLTLPPGAITTRAMISMQTVGTGVNLGNLNLETGTLAECIVGGGPTQAITGDITYTGATISDRVSTTVDLSIVATATDLNRFAITASADATATGGEVIDCHITVYYPPGVTPV